MKWNETWRRANTRPTIEIVGWIDSKRGSLEMGGVGKEKMIQKSRLDASRIKNN